MRAIKTISKQELEALERAGEVGQRSQKVSKPVVPLNPPSDNHALKAVEAAQSVAESMKAITLQAASANSDQVVAMQKTMQQIANSLATISAPTPSWTEISLSVDRDRNDYIKTARITRIK